MVNFVSSIAVDDVIDALVVFLNPFMQGGKIARGQVNRVPMPGGVCAVLTELLQIDTTIPYNTFDPDNDLAKINGAQRIDVQIDFYGRPSGEVCKAVKSAFRTEWGVDQFPANIKPLYTDDGRQSPLITGEQQYESRWTLTTSLQYNPVITVPQQFADTATVNSTQPVDVFENIT